MKYHLTITEDIRNGMLNDFQKNSLVKVGAYKQLEQKPDHEILMRYINWVNRFGPLLPVQVRISNSTLKHPQHKKYKTCIEQIVKRLKDGNSLKPVLSTRVTKRSYVEDSKSDNADKDLLLNFDGIFHFHLGTKIENNELKGDVGDLLFVTTHKQVAYVLGIGTHNDFFTDLWVRVILSEWPEVEIMKRLNGITGSGFSESERENLRRSGMGNPIEVDGALYMSNTLGVTTSGMSILTVEKTRIFQRQLKNTLLAIPKNIDTIAATILKHRDVLPKTLHLGARVNLGHIELIETKHNALFQEFFLR